MGAIPTIELGRYKAVAIGSSTGGPGLVEKIICGQPADLPVPIFIAQHLPPQFTVTFAAQMDQAGALTVVHAEDGMPVYPGTVYVGRGHQHMRVRRSLRRTIEVEVSAQPVSLAYKPSVDELFSSAAQVYGKGLLAIIMTGIGSDGTGGARVVKLLGGTVITQSPETCAVYGMPRSAHDAGLSDAQLTPDQIRRLILQLSPQHHATALAGAA